MKETMTKQKMSVLGAIAVLSLVTAVSAHPIWAQNNTGLPNTNGIQATGPTSTANNGASIAATGSATTGSTAISTTYNVMTDEYDRTNLVTTDLTVGFPIETAVANGSIRVLVATATESASASNGRANEKVFTVKNGVNSSTFTCPTASNGTAAFTAANDGHPTVVLYDVENDRYLASSLDNTTPDGQAGKYIRYLAYTCTYTGTPNRGGEYAQNNDDSSYNIVIKDLINPAAQINASLNEAITIPGKIQMFDGTNPMSANMLSDIDVLISTIMQDVLVKAKVEYQLMFRIDGVEAGDPESKCANKPTVSTTPLKIDYGAATVGVPVDANQRLFVSSSVAHGYKVTVTQNRNMRREDTLNDISNTNDYNSTCYADAGLINNTTINRDCIPNFGWPNVTPYTSAAWADGNQTGLGYTVAVNRYTGQQESGIKNKPTVNSIFEGNKYSRLATRDRTGIVGLIPSTSDNEPPVAASSDLIAEGDYYDFCYSLVVDAQNNAGVYDNEITYTITASL